jgi:hypothetical protein
MSGVQDRNNIKRGVLIMRGRSINNDINRMQKIFEIGFKI